jgi:hypothetical protein
LYFHSAGDFVFVAEDVELGEGGWLLELDQELLGVGTVSVWMKMGEERREREGESK